MEDLKEICSLCANSYQDEDAEGEQWVCCDICDQWDHTTCVHSSALYVGDINAEHDKEGYECFCCKLRKLNSEDRLEKVKLLTSLEIQSLIESVGYNPAEFTSNQMVPTLTKLLEQPAELVSTDNQKKRKFDDLEQDEDESEFSGASEAEDSQSQSQSENADQRGSIEKKQRVETIEEINYISDF